MKCKRVLAVVRRDMAEAIPVIIFCHEYQILQVIHGDAAVSLIENPEANLVQFSPQGMDEAEMKRQIESKKVMLQPAEVDPSDEYNRLVERYGMHSEVRMSNVEYVWGRVNSPTWKRALKMGPEDLGDVSMDESEEPDPAPRRGRNRQEEAAA